jgi:hypothetical protein
VSGTCPHGAAAKYLCLACCGLELQRLYSTLRRIEAIDPQSGQGRIASEALPAAYKPRVIGPCPDTQGADVSEAVGRK